MGSIISSEGARRTVTKALTVAFRIMEATERPLLTALHKGGIPVRRESTPGGGFDKKLSLDTLVEDLAIQVIRRAGNFPKHNIVAEERGVIPGRSDVTWALDMLDASGNLGEGSIIFASSIGLFIENELVAGILNLPAFKEHGPSLFHATRGKGTFYRKASRDFTLQLAPQNPLEPGAYVEVNGSYHRDYDIPNTFQPTTRVHGSNAAAFALMLRGQVRGLALRYCDLYSIAAGVILVREAGGEVLRHYPSGPKESFPWIWTSEIFPFRSPLEYVPEEKYMVAASTTPKFTQDLVKGFIIKRKPPFPPSASQRSPG